MTWKKKPGAALLLLLLVPSVLADTTDYSGNGFNLAVQGDPTLFQSGSAETGLGYAFDGNDCMNDNLETVDRVPAFSYMVVMDTPSSGGITIGGRPQGSTSFGKGAILQANVGGFAWTIGQGDGSPEGAASGSLSGPGPHVIVATYDDSTGFAEVFLNGTSVGSFSYSDPIDWTDTSAGPSPGQFYVGGERTNVAGTACNTNFMVGSIYEIRTFSKVLSQEQIKRLAECETRETAIGEEVRFYHFGLTDYECPEVDPRGGGKFFGDDGFFYNGDKTGYAEKWKLSEEGLDGLYGLILVAFGVWVGWGDRNKKVGPAFNDDGERIGWEVEPKDPKTRAVFSLIGGAIGFIVALMLGLFDYWVLAIVLIAFVAWMYRPQRIDNG